MDNYRECIPQLSGLSRPTSHIAPDAKVKEVVELFRKDHALLALPVVSDGEYAGFVSRKGLFFRRLIHKYALDLYGNKPITVLLEGNTPVMEPELDVNSALVKLLAVDPVLETDCFPVVSKGCCSGIVSVSELMMQISTTQSFLLDKLYSLSARIRDEVDKAAKIQQDLLPESEFVFGDISVGAGVVTSSEVGGDFYDYFTIGDDRLGLIIADVSGHGVQAGMVTTAAKASLHTLIAMGVTTPSQLLEGMNRAIIATACQSLLMTCLIVLVDLRENRLSFANAGHNFPYIRRGRSGHSEQLQEVSGFPLGFEADCRYREFHSVFEKGDTLFLYTDGIVECMNKDGEEFGYERLEGVLSEGIEFSPGAMRGLLLESAMDFVGSGSFEDDVSLLIATYN
jgi:serine phosphatase RsbU (regulator of sigma subunit)/CBS domain-containing protein